MQQTASKSPLAAAAGIAAAVQQVQSPPRSIYPHSRVTVSKLVDVDSKSCIQRQSMWLQAKLTAAKGEGLSVGAEAFN